MKKIFLTLTILLSISVFAEKVTVQEAVEMAIKNNKDIKISMLEYEQSQLDVNKAWKDAYFKINYTAEANYFFKTINSFGSSYDQMYSQNVTLTQPLYTGGGIRAGIKIGENYETFYQLSLDKTRKDVILSTIDAYINLLNAQNNLEVLKLSKETLNKNLEIQKAKYDLRMLTKPDYLESERSVAEIEATVTDAILQIDLAKEVLANFVGVKNVNSLEIVPFTIEEKFSQKVSLENDLSRLPAENTEYKMAVKQKEIAQGNIDYQKSSLMPKVNGFVNYGTSSQTEFDALLKEKNYNGTIGLNVSWKLFDWGQTKDDIKKSDKQYQIYQLKEEDTLDSLRLGLRQVYYQLVSLEKSLDAKKIAMD
ncbi:MAG: TolC family protein, partial [Leptotrichiaceae bacterium]